MTFTVSGSELAITSAGVLTFTSAPDYETKTSYTATVTASDGTNTLTQDISINIIDIDEKPIITSDAIYSVDENQTVIGSITATDESSDLIYEISGTDSASVNINNLTGVMTFVSAPDYETKNTYSMIASVSDDNFTTRKAIQISINNLNDNSPVFTSDTTFSAAENQTSIGTVTATDGDANDIVTFSVSGSELLISSAGVLTFSSAPDYETKISYTATVTATDGTNSATQDIAVNVTNLNDNTPSITSSATFSAAENQTAIGTVTATDEDGETISYSLSGTDASSMSINSSSGVLTFSSAPDYETKTSYSATVTASDGTNSATQDIAVNVMNLNDNTPSITSSATFSAAENQTAIGTVTSTDEDGETISYSLSGTDASSMSINSSSGVLTFSSTPDYETKTSYSATVTATDGTNSTTQNITVNVTNVNDVAPVFTSGATFSAAENQTAIGTITATDVDTDNSSITFTVSGSELSIGSSTGVIAFVSAPDYETKTSYSATVTASDGTNSTTQNITVNVTNLNDNTPSIISSATFSAEENQTSIGAIVASDDDGDTLTYSVSGSDITINSSTGVIVFASAPDYETKTSYSATVTATDGANSTTQNITVNVTNVNEAPTFASSAVFSAAENQTSIGTVTANDVEEDTISYSISGSDITINSSTGVIAFASAPDYETKTSYSATVTATDGTNSATQDITINVTNENDVAPAFTSSATFTANENQTAIGTVTASDIEDDTVTYSISGSDITINSSTGVIAFASAPDYEAKTSYSATVTATDGTNSATQDISVNVNNLNDNSPIFSSTSMVVNEHELTIGAVPVTDLDGDALTYSMSNVTTDGCCDYVLEINSSTGVLYFNREIDYELRTSYNAYGMNYSAQITADDGVNSVSETVSIAVQNINDNSPIISCSNSESWNEYPIYENQTYNLTRCTAMDADGDDLQFTDRANSSVYSLATRALGSSGINSHWGADIQIGPFDYDTLDNISKTGYVNLKVSDGQTSDYGGHWYEVRDVNDNPHSITSSNSFSINENLTYIGDLVINDADTDHSYSYSSSSSDITISGGKLYLASSPDYDSGDTSFSTTITVSDSVYTDSQQVSVNVNNVDEPPIINYYKRVNPTSPNVVYPENTFTFSSPYRYGATLDVSEEAEEAFGLISATDPEGQDVIYSISKICYKDTDLVLGSIYSLYSSVVNSVISCNEVDESDLIINIDQNTGIISSVSSDIDQLPNKKTYSGNLELLLVINVCSASGVCRDNFDSDTWTPFVWLTIGSVNDNAPLFTSNSTFSVNENETSIGRVTTSDLDNTGVEAPDTNTTYSVTSTSNNISINSSTGLLSFTSAPDYETKSSYSATVTASDGTNSTTQDINIQVNNIDDNDPVITNSTNQFGLTVFFSDENQTAIGTITATDIDGDSIYYCMPGGTSYHQDHIDIDRDTGVMTWKEAPDYENPPIRRGGYYSSSYWAIVNVSDEFCATSNGWPNSRQVEIFINDVDD